MRSMEANLQPTRGALRIRITSRQRCSEREDADAELIADAYHFVMVSGTMDEATRALESVRDKPAWMASMAPSAHGVMFDFGGVNLAVGDELEMASEP